jgi:hypothetical protein
VRTRILQWGRSSCCSFLNAAFLDTCNRMDMDSTRTLCVPQQTHKKVEGANQIHECDLLQKEKGRNRVFARPTHTKKKKKITNTTVKRDHHQNTLTKKVPSRKAVAIFNSKVLSCDGSCYFFLDLRWQPVQFDILIHDTHAIGHDFKQHSNRVPL